MWNDEELTVLNRLDQGEVTEYKPSVTLADLTGHGAPVATDTPLGKVETALRAMRTLGGGRAFNSDLGVTGDTKEVTRRYVHDKKPVFFNSAEEKAWIESSSRRLKILGPEELTKKTILETTIMGKHAPPSYADASDTLATMTNYHARTFSYKTSDSKAFIAKVASLLPAQPAARPDTPAAKRA